MADPRDIEVVVRLTVRRLQDQDTPPGNKWPSVETIATAVVEYIDAEEPAVYIENARGHECAYYIQAAALESVKTKAATT